MALSSMRFLIEEKPRRALVPSLDWKEPIAVEVTFRLTLVGGGALPGPRGEWCTRVFRVPGAPPVPLDDCIWIPMVDL